MYVYRVYNKEYDTFIKNHNTSHQMWIRKSDAEKNVPWYAGKISPYEVKKYELVEVPCE